MEDARKRIDESLDKLAAALEQGQSETLRQYLAVMGRFCRYSLGNAMLIAMQRPDATQIAGFHAWKKLGRHVKAGEHGIAIIAPVVRREQRADGKDDPETRKVVAFKGARVFDVSQTEGRPLPEFAQVQGDAAEQLDRLKGFVASRGIALAYSEDLGGAMGLAGDGRIILRSGMPVAEEFSTLAHEVGHSILHQGSGNTVPRAVRELEAEAVAFVVCQAAGLECGTAASDYIQLYQGDRKLLMASLERIRGAAAEIIGGLGLDGKRAPDPAAGEQLLERSGSCVGADKHTASTLLVA